MIIVLPGGARALGPPLCSGTERGDLSPYREFG
jgi:hypothetical protein